MKKGAIVSTGLFIFIISLTLVSAGDWTSNLDDKLFVYYTLNETSGNFLDLTRNATATEFNFTEASSRGITLITKQNGAVNFTTNGDYINVSAIPSNMSQFSFNLWIYNHNFADAGDGRFHVYSDRCGSAAERNFWFVTTTIIQVGVAGDSFDINALPSSKEWHMVTVTYDGDTISYYQDGIKNATFNAPDSLINTNGNAVVSLGNACTGTGLNYPSKSYLDEFAFWANKNLSSSDISYLYDSGNGTFKTNVETIQDPEPNPTNATFYNVSVANDLSVEGNALIKFLGTITNRVKSLFVENANIENLNVTGSVTLPHEISQPERYFNIVYFNNNSRPLMVYGSALVMQKKAGDGARVVLKTDNNSTPSTIVQNSGFDSFMPIFPGGVERHYYFGFSMIVAPNNFYKIENITSGISSVSLDRWNEVEI